jgi:AraC-like DNA-binding protein
MTHALEMIPAHPGLHPAITYYYRLRLSYSVIDEWLLADSGHLWFFVSGGEGYIDWRQGERLFACPAMCTGPLSHSARMRLSGPMEYVGIPLTPEAWGRLLREDAEAYVDTAVDARLVLGDMMEEMAAAVRAAVGMRNLADRLDALLLPRLRPMPEAHRAVLGAIRTWLNARMFPHVDELYAHCRLSSRQVMRIAKRYYGAPPKLLARKYGALRTASAIVADQGRPPTEAVEHYADQSHMTRDLRQFTGQTPRGLRTRSSPLARQALSLGNFPEIIPYA